MTSPCPQVAALVAAMNEEAEVTYPDIERCKARFLRRCPPGQPAQACAVCGTCDVPVLHSTIAEADRVGVRQFITQKALPSHGRIYVYKALVGPPGRLGISQIVRVQGLVLH